MRAAQRVAWLRNPWPNATATLDRWSTAATMASFATSVSEYETDASSTSGAAECACSTARSTHRPARDAATRSYATCATEQQALATHATASDARSGWAGAVSDRS